MEYVIKMHLDTEPFLDGKAPAEVADVLANISNGIHLVDKLESGVLKDSEGNEVGVVYAPDMVLVSRKDVEWLERLSGKEIKREKFFS